MVTDEQISFLHRCDQAVLADWWCILNRGDRPAPLEGLSDDECVAAMFWITRKIGWKAVLRVWNAGMSEEDFEVFWAARCGDPLAELENLRRLDGRIRRAKAGLG